MAGTVTGGPAENGTDAAAISAFSSDLSLLEKILKDISDGNITDFTEVSYENLILAASRTGMTWEEADAYAECYMAEQDQLFRGAVGKSIQEIESEEELAELLGSLSEEERTELFDSMLAI